jgi:hypothetical protein
LLQASLVDEKTSVIVQMNKTSTKEAIILFPHIMLCRVRIKDDVFEFADQEISESMAFQGLRRRNRKRNITYLLMGKRPPKITVHEEIPSADVWEPKIPCSDTMTSLKLVNEFRGMMRFARGGSYRSDQAASES